MILLDVAGDCEIRIFKPFSLMRLLPRAAPYCARGGVNVVLIGASSFGPATFTGTFVR